MGPFEAVVILPAKTVSVSSGVVAYEVEQIHDAAAEVVLLLV